MFQNIFQLLEKICHDKLPVTYYSMANLEEVIAQMALPPTYHVVCSNGQFKYGLRQYCTHAITPPPLSPSRFNVTGRTPCKSLAVRQ